MICFRFNMLKLFASREVLMDFRFCVICMFPCSDAFN
jgi:hypothetical protein